VRAVPRLCELYPGICLTTEEKAWKNLSQDSQRMPVGTMKTECTEQNNALTGIWTMYDSLNAYHFTNWQLFVLYIITVSEKQSHYDTVKYWQPSYSLVVCHSVATVNTEKWTACVGSRPVTHRHEVNTNITAWGLTKLGQVVMLLTCVKKLTS
jgi:hypothetical protein